MPPARWNHPDILKERKQEIPRRSFFGVALTMQPKKNRIFAQLKMEEAMFKRKIRNWRIPRNGEITEFDKKILAFQNKGGYTSTALLQRRRSVCNRHHLRPPRWPTPFRIRRLSACGVS